MATPQPIAKTQPPIRETQTHPAFRHYPPSFVLMIVSLRAQFQGPQSAL